MNSPFSFFFRSVVADQMQSWLYLYNFQPPKVAFHGKEKSYAVMGKAKKKSIFCCSSI